MDVNLWRVDSILKAVTCERRIKLCHVVGINFGAGSLNIFRSVTGANFSVFPFVQYLTRK